MREIAYKVLDYFYEHKRARAAWMYASFIGLALAAISLPWGQYALVILFGVLLNWHGLVDGLHAGLEGDEGDDE